MPHNWLSYNYAARGGNGIQGPPGTGGNPGGGGGGGGGGGTPSNTIILSLVDQNSVSDLSFPTHFSVPLAQGTLTSQQLYLQETLPGGSPSSIIADFEPVCYWPDNSIKWLHIYANVRWVGGQKSAYALRWGPNISGAPTTPLFMRQTPSGIAIDTGAANFIIPNDEPIVFSNGVISSGSANSYFTAQANLSGQAPTFTYRANRVWPTVTVEQSGTAKVCIKLEGNLINPTGAMPWARYVTRISAYANSPLVDFNHATIFTTGMKQVQVVSINHWFKDFAGEILTRKMAEKAPTSITTAGGGGVLFNQWPAGRPDYNTPADYSSGVLYQFRYLKNNPTLNINMPGLYTSGLAQLLRFDGADIETIPTYAQNADLAGVSMHNEFAINLGANGGSGLQSVYENRPIGYLAPIPACATLAMGPLAASGGQYTAIDNLVVASLSGHYHAIDRYGEYGWHIYGNTHHDERISLNRPSMTRVWANNHYWQGSTLWRTFFTTANTGILKFARIATDYLSSIGQVKHTYSGVPDAVQTGVGDHYRTKGAIYHCKATIPFGFRFHSDWSDGDVDTGFASHFIDSPALLWAWIHDADRWALQGYNDWISGVNTVGQLSDGYADWWPVGSWNREVNNSLYNALVAYEYNPNFPGILTAIQGMATGLINVPLTGQTTGPLWEPEWLSKHYELFPGNLAFKNFLLVSASSVCPVPQTDGDFGYALSATAYDITRNPTHLTQYSGALDRTMRRLTNDPNNSWQNHGNAPSPDYDNIFCLQWPRLKYQLDRYATPMPNCGEIGNWFFSACRYSGDDSPGTWHGTANTAIDGVRRGTEIYILGNTTNPTPVTLDAWALIGGDPSATSFYWTQTSGTLTALSSRIPMSQSPKVGQNGGPVISAFRPSTWKVYREQYSIPSTGLTKAIFAGGITLHRPLTQFPELQVLHNRVISDWGGDVITYTLKACSGVLYPLTNSSVTMKVAPTQNSINSYVGTHVNIGTTDEWLLPGTTGTYTIPASPTITPLTIFTEGFGDCTIWFVGGQDKLFYFGNQSDINAIIPSLNNVSF